MIRADRNLSGESLAARINRSANYAGELGVNKGLTAYHNKQTIFLWVTTRLVDAVNFSPLHCCSQSAISTDV